MCHDGKYINIVMFIITVATVDSYPERDCKYFSSCRVDHLHSPGDKLINGKLIQVEHH